MPAPLPRESLLAIDRLLGDSHPHLPSETWNRIKELGINRHKVVKRGTRCGRRLHRHIPVVTYDRNVHSRHGGVNHNNLIQVSTRPKVSNSDKYTNLTLLNVRSVAGKCVSLSEYIADHDVGIMALTETWLKSVDDPLLNDLVPEGFKFLGAPRPTSKGSRGGGVGFVLKSSFDVVTQPQPDYRTFETYAIKLNSKHPTTLVLVYRPPPSSKNRLTAAGFFKELQEFLSHLCSSVPGDLCIMGDFNVHLDQRDKAHPRQLQDILSELDLVQHVSGATHREGHTLDLVITRNDSSSLVQSITVDNPSLSDHYAVSCQLRTSPKVVPGKSRMARKLKRVAPEEFAADLQALLPAADGETTTCVNDLLTEYDSRLSEVLDSHAPSQKISIKGDSLKPWYDDNIHTARRERRQLERKAIWTGLEVHRQMFQEKSKEVVQLINASKSTYYHNKLSAANTKETFRVINSLLCYSVDAPLPPSISDLALANDFAQFFEGKVAKIRHDLDQKDPSTTVQPLHTSAVAQLSHYRLLTQSDLSKVISKCATKSCSLDTIPTSFLKNPAVLSTVTPVLTSVVNTSLSTGVFPDQLKCAQVVPLLKKPGLDVTNFANYRPVSNIPFLSKVIERVIASQLNSHLTLNGLHDPLQSAYKQGSSTETALIRIKADMEEVLNAGDGVLLVLLDLSAAFDTVDHTILLERLQEEVGLQDTALQWIRSYLTGRTQAVHINNTASAPTALTTGVPQGSVLGPLLFLIYLLPLRRVMDLHRVKRHGFADDTQLYNRLSIRNAETLSQQVQTMENCIADVRSWMTMSKLMLNDAKTEVMIITKKNDVKCVRDIAVTIGEESISPKPVVKNLGATLDAMLSMEQQVNAMTRKMYFNIRRIAKVKYHLTKEACTKAINTTVIVHLDYHNGLLLGAPDKTIRKLQVAQNSAARLLTGTPRRDHIKPVLYHLHWLPVRQRITFKVITIIQKSLHSPTSPSYMRELCPVYNPGRALRSSSDTWKLEVTKSSNKYGARSFTCLGATLWNELPADIRGPITHATFRKQLKTVLFKEVYG